MPPQVQLPRLTPGCCCHSPVEIVYFQRQVRDAPGSFAAPVAMKKVSSSTATIPPPLPTAWGTGLGIGVQLSPPVWARRGRLPARSARTTAASVLFFIGILRPLTAGGGRGHRRKSGGAAPPGEDQRGDQDRHGRVAAGRPGALLLLVV